MTLAPGHLPFREYRLQQSRAAAEAAGRRLEVWTGDGQTPQRFTCPDHAGVALTWAELLAGRRESDAWLFVREWTPDAWDVAVQKQRGHNAGAIHALDAAFNRALEYLSDGRGGVKP